MTDQNSQGHINDARPHKANTLIYAQWYSNEAPLYIRTITVSRELTSGRIKTRAAHFLEFSVRTAMHGISIVSSAISVCRY